MKLVQEYVGESDGLELGEELTKLESIDGIQSFVFFTQQITIGASGTNSI
jgi:hypothetical protein